MRCKNCGWPNKPEVTKCVKCGEPLTGEPQASFNAMGGGTVPMGGDVPEPSNLKKTVIETGGVIADYAHQQGPVDHTVPLSQEGQGGTCSKCGYLLRPDATKCPNCNTPVNSKTVDLNEMHRQPEPPVNHHPGNHQRQTTINPYLMDMDPTPMCSLKPIKKVNERKELSVNEYEGKEILLERGNTDPDNGSITSKGQARLTFVDGAWFLEDMSEQKTSFLQLGRKTEIKDGDIILLGNRLFEFHV